MRTEGDKTMVLLLLMIVVILVVQEYLHRKTSYYRVTKTPYLQVIFNLGKYGEYLTYKHLRHYEQGGARFLYNLYIPKGTGGTTEIDVLMISRKGLFVFESKNYSGWIFGSENQRNWYQTLPKGRGKSHKEAFYNPVMQNRTHMKHLKALLGEDIPMHSIITFSDRCTLKNIVLISPDVHVINRSRVGSVVAAICSNMGTVVLNDQQITAIYDRLYPFSQVNSDVKLKHIEEIQRKTEAEYCPRTERGQNPEEETPLVTETDAVDSAVEPMKCPKCGGDLVLRRAKKGSNAGNEFYGCANFPKCRFIRDL